MIVAGYSLPCAVNTSAVICALDKSGERYCAVKDARRRAFVGHSAGYMLETAAAGTASTFKLCAPTVLAPRPLAYACTTSSPAERSNGSTSTVTLVSRRSENVMADTGENGSSPTLTRISPTSARPTVRLGTLASVSDRDSAVLSSVANTLAGITCEMEVAPVSTGRYSKAKLAARVTVSIVVETVTVTRSLSESTAGVLITSSDTELVNEAPSCV